MNISRSGALMVATCVLAAMVAGAVLFMGTGAQHGQAEAVAVHGHWDLTVRNADGSVAQHHAFENSLTESGQDVLVKVFGQTGRVGAWLIVLGTPDGYSDLNPCGDDASPQRCVITDTTVEANPAGGAGFIAVSGQTTATRDGQVGFVQTAVQGEPCDPSLSIDTNCPLNDYITFTEAEPREPPAGEMFHVSQGQVIQVRVEISFS